MTDHPPGPRTPVRIPPIPVGLSTASVYPASARVAFELAAELGYDGVEVMVQTELLTQDADELARLVDTFHVPVLSVHSPCLLVTAAVWGADPLVKLARSVDLAERLGAGVVVTHPPFVWQRAAADTFTAAVQEIQGRTAVRVGVENMFPLRVAGTTVNSYRPHWDPLPAGHEHFTLDLSHTATSGSDAIAMAKQMGERLAHVHLADGSGASRDEHLVPGRGGQPCGELLGLLTDTGFTGSVILEVSTRGRTVERRRDDLAEALSFARLHLAAPVGDSGPAGGAEPL